VSEERCNMRKHGRQCLTRREFMWAAGAFAGAGALAACERGGERQERPSPLAVQGATPEERALNLIKALKNEGRVKDGDQFVVMHHSGQRQQLVPALKEWNRLTGLEFVSSEVGLEADIYTKAINEATVRSGNIDVFLTFVNWNADLAESGLILDQTAWWQSYDPEVDHGPNAYLKPLDSFTSLYKGRRFSMGADNDAFSMFYRKDLEPGDVPQTWEEFDRWVVEHNRPDQRLRGLHMYAERFFAYTGWAARFISKGGAYFNDNMDPLIVSDEGVAALEEQKRLVDQVMWPDAVSGDWTVAYSRFPEGSVFCAWAWPSLGQWAENPKTSKVAGKVSAMPLPGTMHDGELVRAVPHVVGWSFSISRYGKAPEAAYAFIQWFCGPKVGLEAINRTGTLDPYRTPWYQTEQMKKRYGEDLLRVLLQMTPQTFPDISLRGANQYLDNLNLNLQQGFSGRKSPEQALKDTADEWQKITDRIGRGLQIDAWRSHRNSYPEQIRNLWRKKGVFKD
jgi:multiple sugar transport system substrate-binding protein